MYSNNILNFQESWPTLNSCKKCLETYWRHRVCMYVCMYLSIYLSIYNSKWPYEKKSGNLSYASRIPILYLEIAFNVLSSYLLTLVSIYNYFIYKVQQLELLHNNSCLCCIDQYVTIFKDAVRPCEDLVIGKILYSMSKRTQVSNALSHFFFKFSCRFHPLIDPGNTRMNISDNFFQMVQNHCSFNETQFVLNVFLRRCKYISEYSNKWSNKLISL